MQDNDFFVSELTSARFPVFMNTYLAPPVPPSMISAELTGLYGTNVLKDMYEIIRLYNIYERGADFLTEGTNGDYNPSDLRYKKVKQLVDKQARFLFSKTPDMKIYSPDTREEVQNALRDMKVFLDVVLSKVKFPDKLLKAAKDCFIGKRVACFLNFNDDGIRLEFSPSLEFVYDVDPRDASRMTKIVAFYTVDDSKNKKEQRIYRKRYWMGTDNLCWVDEGLYDGLGDVVEVYVKAQPTRFPYIPAVVILNDDLTGGLKGTSEVEQLMHSESWYSRMANSDMDAERRGMNPIRYTVDMNTKTTKGLNAGPGAYWDLQSDLNSTVERVVGQIGILESAMSYSEPLGNTLDRIKADMYDMVDMPDLRMMDFKVASAKALRAVYWSLLVRCEEKMLAWRPALEFIIRCIMDGARYYPNSALPYVTKDFTILKNELFQPKVENQYPLPEDEAEEKNVDVLEVTTGVMSRKSYMKKWYNLNDEEAEAELSQIEKERKMFGETQDNSDADMVQGSDIDAANRRNNNKSVNSQRQQEGKKNPTK